MSGRSVVLSVMLFLASVASAAPAETASPDMELAKGIKATQRGDFDSAIVTLDAVVRRLAAEGGHPNELSRAYTYLSIAYLGLSQEQIAKSKFLEAWKMNHGMELSSTEFPPKVLQFFEKMQREAKAATEVRPTIAPPPAATAAAVDLPTPGIGRKRSAVPFLAAGGGVAALGIGLAASGGGGGAEPTPVSSVTPTPGPTATATAAPTPTPTATPAGEVFAPSFRVSPFPPQGGVPLSVDFNMCQTTGDGLKYTFDFGDGGRDSGFCRSNHVYTSSGEYNATMCVTDGRAPQQCQTTTVRATEEPPTSSPGGPGGGGPGGGAPVTCAQNQFCPGTVISCTIAGDDSDGGAGSVVQAGGGVQVTFGSWVDAVCLTFGSGWHATTDSRGFCGQTFTTATPHNQRCTSVVVQP
jgi:hypothetical protein